MNQLTNNSSSYEQQIEEAIRLSLISYENETKRRHVDESSSTQISEEPSKKRTKISSLEKQNSFQPLQVKWLHGTSGISLLLLKKTNFALIPFGRLYEKKIVPITGELTDGIKFFGVNNKFLSGMKFEDSTSLTTVWRYASLSKKFADFEANLVKKIEETLSQAERSIKRDPQKLPLQIFKELGIRVLQLRQLNDSLYQEKFNHRISNLKEAHSIENYIISSRINSLRKAMGIEVPTQQDNDGSILNEFLEEHFEFSGEWKDDFCGYQIENRLIGYREKFSKRMIKFNLIGGNPTDKECITSVIATKFHDPKFYEENKWKIEKGIKKIERHVQREVQRISQSLDPSPTPIRFSEQEVFQIKNIESFPLILASTKEEGLSKRGGLRESPVERDLYLGTDIDVMITNAEHIDEIRKFVLENGFENSISVFTDKEFEKITGRSFAA